MSTVQLEKLEVVMEIDTEQVQQNLERLQPRLEKLLSRIEQNFGRKMKKAEDSLDVSQGVEKTSNQMQELTNRSKRVASSMERTGMTVQRVQQNVGQVTQSMKRGFEAVPESLDLIADEMYRNQEVAKRLKKQIRLLNNEYESQKEVTGMRDGQMIFGDTEASLKTLAKIQKLQEQTANLAQKNDLLRKTYSEIEDRIASTAQKKTGFKQILAQVAIHTQGLRENIEKSNGALGRKNTNLKASNHNLGRMKQIIQKAKNSMSKFGGVSKRTSNNIAHGTRKSSKGFLNMGDGLRRLMRNLIVFNLIRRGITAMATGLFSALRTNDQFNASLNQIRGNLLTAFYPIFTAVLPAINALASALARATAYLASFISLLFGTTFESSRAGAEGLYGAVQDMNDVGGAASGAAGDVEELQRALMGFDEINRLDDPNAGGGGDGAGGIDWGGIIDPGVPAWLNRIKDLLARFFDPFRAAWERYGYRVIREWQHMLREVGNLAVAIGRSFMEVWTNGTGEQFIGNILNITANLLGLVGDLAKAFRTAWEYNDVGTRIIQGVFDIFNDLLARMNNIIKATREWARNLDFTPLLNSIATLLESLRPLADRLGAGLEWFYTNALLPLARFTISNLIPAFLDTLSSVLEVLTSTIDALRPLGEWLWNNLLQPLATWTGGAIITILEGLTVALRGISNWINENQQLFETIMIILGSFVGAWKLVKFAIEVVLPILKKLKGAWTVLKTALALITTPVGWVVLAIGAVIAIGVLLWRNWETISEWAHRAWNSVKDSVGGAIQSVLTFFNEVNWLDLAAGIVEGLILGFRSAMANVGAWMREIVFDPIVSWFKNLFRMSSPSKVFEGFGGYLIQGLMNGIGNLMMGPINLITGLWTDIRNGSSERLSEIRNNVSESWANIRDNITERVSQARDNVQNRWDDIRTNTTTAFTNVRDRVRDRLTQTRDNTSERARDVFNNIRDRWRDVSNSTSNTFNNVRDTIGNRFNGVRDTVSNQAQGAFNATRDRWSDMSRDTSQRMNEIRNQTRDRWNQLRSDVANATQAMQTNARDRFNQIRDEAWYRANHTRNLVRNSFDAMRNESSVAFNGIATSLSNVFNQIVNTSRGLGQRMASAINAGAPAMRAAANNLGNSFNSNFRQMTARMPVAQSFSGGFGGGAYGGYGYGGGGVSSLLSFAHEYLGASQGFELTLPNSVIALSPMDSFRQGGDSQLQMRSAQDEREKSFMQQILSAIKANNAYQGETTLILQLDGTVLGRICIRELNRITQQSGVFPLEIR